MKQRWIGLPLSDSVKEEGSRMPRFRFLYKKTRKKAVVLDRRCDSGSRTLGRRFFRISWTFKRQLQERPHISTTISKAVGLSEDGSLRLDDFPLSPLFCYALKGWLDTTAVFPSSLHGLNQNKNADQLNPRLPLSNLLFKILDCWTADHVCLYNMNIEMLIIKLKFKSIYFYVFCVNISIIWHKRLDLNPSLTCHGTFKKFSFVLLWLTSFSNKKNEKAAGGLLISLLDLAPRNRFRFTGFSAFHVMSPDRLFYLMVKKYVDHHPGYAVLECSCLSDSDIASLPHVCIYVSLSKSMNRLLSFIYRIIFIPLTHLESFRPLCWALGVKIDSQRCEFTNYFNIWFMSISLGLLKATSGLRIWITTFYYSLIPLWIYPTTMDCYGFDQSDYNRSKNKLSSSEHISIHEYGWRSCYHTSTSHKRRKIEESRIS